jgi:glycosyltransferase involved in cell wall biosynthesis
MTLLKATDHTVPSSRRVLFLEPFYGGSHREFADGLIEHSRHAIELHTLPARFWKWRLRGAALHFAEKIRDPGSYDALITTDLLSLSDLKALWGRAFPPALVYFHENQLTYPLAPGERMDLQYGFTDITTALAAKRVLFNSHTHFQAFFEGLPGFIRNMPEYRPRWVIEAIRNKSGVLYPGCRFPADREAITPTQNTPSSAGEAAPLIIWNHRWEFDKNPELFFSVLQQVDETGGSFRLALLGENYQKVPQAFVAARRRWGRSIEQYGYVSSRERYLSWLKRGGIVVSTAEQENFGISVVEAIRHGCFPLLPRKLSYPELIPNEFHDDVLFGDRRQLAGKLSRLLAGLRRADPALLAKTRALALSMNRFSWHNLIGSYDRELDRLSRLQPG